MLSLKSGYLLHIAPRLNWIEKNKNCNVSRGLFASYSGNFKSDFAKNLHVKAVFPITGNKIFSQFITRKKSLRSEKNFREWDNNTFKWICFSDTPEFRNFLPETNECRIIKTSLYI